MDRQAATVLVVVLVVVLSVLPVFAEVESVTVSPSVIMVGEPITFSGTVSGSSVNDRLAISVYLGANCPANSTIASAYILPSNVTYTTVTNTFGVYNVSLIFPPNATSGWNVKQQYQNGFPAGSYSVGVQDVVSSAGLCKNFQVTGSSTTPEFSDSTLLLTLALLTCLLVVPSKISRRFSGKS
jgi:hypothetical protein